MVNSAIANTVCTPFAYNKNQSGPKTNLACQVKNQTGKVQTCRVIVNTKVEGGKKKRFRGVLEINKGSVGVLILRGNKHILKKGDVKGKAYCQPLPEIPGQPYEDWSFPQCEKFLELCEMAHLTWACEKLKLECPPNFRRRNRRRYW
ncbi:MAG: hypothetical protein DRQ88_01215 [Epsilonproteobacteria bacterium]|nr:MAG: hypothetical protein DRQ89_05285 [Campylobacterota bacterium]RLA67913.1 MAG: hypothetical protein DRQ88_01215 [Campylobacterota bacterium]